MDKTRDADILKEEENCDSDELDPVNIHTDVPLKKKRLSSC